MPAKLARLSLRGIKTNNAGYRSRGPGHIGAEQFDPVSITKRSGERSRIRPTGTATFSPAMRFRRIGRAPCRGRLYEDAMRPTTNGVA